METQVSEAAEPKVEAELWSCRIDDEQLTRQSMDEAIEDSLDDIGVRFWPATVKVYGFAPAKISDVSIERAALFAANEVIAQLAETYGDPDGDYDIEPSAEAKAAAIALAKIVAEEFPVWLHRRVETREVNTLEWILEHAPIWLEREDVRAWVAKQREGAAEPAPVGGVA